MSNILQVVYLLKDKLDVLLSNYNFLKKENEILLEDNNKLQILLKEKEQQLKMYKEEMELLKVAKTIEGSSESIKETKLKINALIREIDKCIIQLNS